MKVVIRFLSLVLTICLIICCAACTPADTSSENTDITDSSLVFVEKSIFAKIKERLF